MMMGRLPVKARRRGGDISFRGRVAAGGACGLTVASVWIAVTFTCAGLSQAALMQ
ncbi:hypothetical protein BO443_40349 [Burkholderia orbicola]